MPIFFFKKLRKIYVKFTIKIVLSITIVIIWLFQNEGMT